MFRKQATVFVSAVLALAANACATRDARPVPAVAIACPGGTLRSAADLERYSGCGAVQGDLTVSAPDVEDLSALSQLHVVTGTLTVTSNPELDDLEGLEGLSVVGGLEISNNPGLTDLTGLDGLIDAKRVVISGNGIYTARGLGHLRQVDHLILENNHKLNSLAGLSSLTNARLVTIEGNPLLCASGMLPALHSVGDAMRLRANRAISPREAKLVLERAGQGEGNHDFAPATTQAVASAH